MATTNQKRLEFERLKSLVNQGQPHEALKDLLKIARKNNLTEESEQLTRMKESLEYLDAHLQANSIEPMFGGSKRNRLIFDLLELIDSLQERKDVEATFHGKKAVNLLLSPSIGLNEEKRNAIVKTLEKILGVSGDNIDIEQVVSR